MRVSQAFRSPLPTGSGVRKRVKSSIDTTTEFDCCATFQDSLR
ncbi:hypothetical protein ABZS68_39970 [Streptomyces sp. NPDC005571]